MTAAAQSASAADGSALTALGEGGGDAPLLAPLAWATLAAARREDLAGAAPEAAPAAAVGTGQAAQSTDGLGATNASITGLNPSSGLVGATFQILGNNFPAKGTQKGQIKSIQFCGDNCALPGNVSTEAFTVDSSSQITVTIPADAKSGKIRLVVASGGVTPDYVLSPVEFTFIKPSITKLDPNSGLVGSTVVITGSDLNGATAVSFCGASAKCATGVPATFTVNSASQITATVPDGAVSGPIQVTITPTALATSTTNYTVVSANAPSISSIDPSVGNIGSEVVIAGDRFTDATSVKFCGSAKDCSPGAPAEFSVNDAGTQITATVPDAATAGPIQVVTPDGSALSPTDYSIVLDPLPVVSKTTCVDGGGGYCGIVLSKRTLVINALSSAFAESFPSSGPAGKCTDQGCPIPFGQTTPSVANIVGIYGFNLVYSLSGKNTPAPVIGQALVNLVTQPALLSFISQTVAGNQALAAVPPAVSTTIGNAVATFVQNSFGNLTVATAFVPFLRALNLPTSANTVADINFFIELNDQPKKALLGRFNSDKQIEGQAALQNDFFGNTGVQTILGQAFADSVNVIVGSPAVTGYLGQVAASALLGQQVDATNPLAVTIGGAIGNLFGSIGGTVATAAGNALANLLAQPALGGQPAVATTLANDLVNQVVTALGGRAPFAIQDGLLPALAPAAGVAVNGFVNSLLSQSTVPPALGTFVTQVTAGVLGDAEFQAEIGQQVSAIVTQALGPGPLAALLAPQVGAAVQGLLANPAVAGPLSVALGAAVPAFLNQQGVVTALAGAAGQLATAALNGTLPTVLPVVVAALGANSAIDAAINVVVSGAVTQLLGNTAVLSAVDAAVSSLVVGLLANPAVQTAIGAQVAAEVAKQFGQAVGAQVAATVVALLGNPIVDAALEGVVDTLFSDLFGYPGVVGAFASAAGQLAAAVAAGDLKTVQPKVIQQLLNNPALQAGVSFAVGGAVTTLLTDTALLPVVDAQLASLISELLTDTAVQAEVSTLVATTVSNLFNGGELGQQLGAQAAAAVVALMTNPAVSAALPGLLDTFFRDFLGAPGVVSAFAGVASQLALSVLAGVPVNTALTNAVKSLQQNTAVLNGLGTVVGDAVVALLDTPELWAAVDAQLTTLVTDVLADATVQDKVAAGVAAEVVKVLGDGVLGTTVGAQVGAAVVALMANPVVSAALAGVVDTVFVDFFGTPGVASAFGTAAGDLAVAALVGDLPEARPFVIAQLRANPAVDAGVQFAVGGAVTTLLTDTVLWSTVDAQLSALVLEILGDSVVQQAAGDEVAAAVSRQLGGGDLGDTVGAQVGETVAALVGNPVVGAALVEVVDTLTVDFFRAPGVVSAFADAAGDVALAAVVGDDIQTAVKAAQASLRANPAVQDGASLAVGDAVTVLLTDTALLPVLDAAAASLITEVLNDSPVQLAVDDVVSAQVSALLQGGTLGNTVGAQVGAAVVDLMTTSAVEQILPALFDTLISDFFSGPGVVSTIADTASQLTLAVITGVPVKTAVEDAQKALRASTAIEDSAGAAVGAGLTQVLDDTALWATVDLEVSTVIDEVLTDSVVQQAVNERVTSVVAQQLGGELGQIVGAQVGAAVVALMGNSVVQGALNDLVDTVFSDFFGTFGVVTVFASAASELTAAAVKGDLPAVRPFVIAQLRDNPNIDAGVQLAVGGAVTTLLKNTALWSVVDQQVASLITEVLADSAVQQAVDERVAAEISRQLGGELGAIVGAQAGAAVAGLLGNPAISGALVELVDTVTQDFFGFPGVVTAFADAASEVALAVVIGDDVQAAQKAALAALRVSPAVDGGAELAVGAAVNQLLTDTAALSAVQNTLTSLVTGLLGDAAFEDALDQRIATDVANQLGGELGQTVGPQVAAAVTTLLVSPELIGVAAALIQTVFTDFIGAPAVVNALTNAASDLAVLLVTGEENIPAAIASVVATLRVNPGLDAAVNTTVTDATAQLLGNLALVNVVVETLGTLVTELVDDVVVEQAVGTAAGTLVAGFLSGSPLAPIAGPVGQATGAAVQQLLATAGAGPVAGAVIESLLLVFLSQPGVDDVLAEAAGLLGAAAVAGDPPEVSQAILTALLGSPPIQAAVTASVSDVADELLSNTAVVAALGAAVATFVTDVVANPDVDQFAGAAVAGLVTGFLNPSPIAGPVGQALGAAVQQLLATPGLAIGLGTVLGSVLPDFFGAAGVPAIVADVAGRVAAVLVSGEESPAAVVQQALADLGADPTIQAALRTTLSDVLTLAGTTLLSDLIIQQSIGTIVTTLIIDLASDPSVQTAVEDQLGPTLGPVLAGLLTDTTVVDGTASLLGAAVAEFLAYPGFNTALTDSLDQLANAVLDGTPANEALQSALRSLQSSPAFVGAANAIVPPTVNAVLAYPQVRQAVGVAAQQEAIAALQRAGISNRFLDGVAGQLAMGTAEAFLDKTAGITLIDTIAVRIVEGMPLNEVTTFATEEIVRSLSLQLALGFSIGQGIGSLFGDNIVGDLIGLVAAFPATLAVSVTAGIVGIYQWLFGAPSVGVDRNALAAQALAGDSRFFQPLPGAADLYVMDALVAAQPEGDQPRTVDITMAVGSEVTGSAGAPLVVGFRFRVGRLLATPESVAYSFAGAPRIELVS